MNQKIGRNDPCSCGSGKKYKVCCLAKKSQPRSKPKVKWLNAPKAPNLMERAFGNVIASDKTFTPVQEETSHIPERPETPE